MERNKTSSLGLRRAVFEYAAYAETDYVNKRLLILPGEPLRYPHVPMVANNIWLFCRCLNSAISGVDIGVG